MTVVSGSFDADDKELILEVMLDAAERAFGESLDSDEASVIRAFYDPVAGYLSQQQDDIANVLSSTQIDNAEGQALDFLAALIGVSRIEAQAATTRLQFQRDSRTSSDYTIPAGTRVQTDETDPVYFETEQPVELKYLDGFESGSLSDYSGDTGNFTAQNGTGYSDSYALEGAAATGLIFSESKRITRGSVFHVRQYLEAGAIAGTIFAFQDTNNYYSAIVDESLDEIRLEKTFEGSTEVIERSSVTIPSGQWLDVAIDFGNYGEIEVAVDEDDGTEVISHVFDDGGDYLDTGGMGFESYDSNALKYWDDITMSAVGAPAVATEKGVTGNVGPGTLTVPTQRVSGIDSYTNPIEAAGGLDREGDENYRERAKVELSSGMRASLPALISQLRTVEGTKSVTVIVNDSNSADADGRPGHSFEAIVEAPTASDQEIAETILETKAAGDTSVGGYDGSAVTKTTELQNGQTKDITFSKPSTLKVYMDIDLTKNNNYSGDGAVLDNVVQYVGGTLSTGDTTGGDLGAGDDVIYNQIVEAIMTVNGVEDITNLEIGTVSDPSGTSNVSVANSEVATIDATDGTLSITSSDA